MGSGVFYETLDIQNTYRLPDRSSVFQLETLAISEACDIIGENSSSSGRNAIFIKLGFCLVNSALVRQCLTTCQRLTPYHIEKIDQMPKV